MQPDHNQRRTRKAGNRVAVGSICCWHLKLILLVLTSTVSAEAVAGGSIQAKIEWVLGSQNTYTRVGIFAFAAAPGRASLEAGAAFWLYRYQQRYGAAENNWGLGYETFALAGIGDNRNLLGSTVSYYQTDSFFDMQHAGDFAGLGFAVSRDVPLGSLRKFAVQRGHALIRVAHGQRSLHLNFANDLRVGPFRGAAKDLGPTGSLQLGYAQIKHNRLQQIMLGFDVFTPQPDYARAPSNPQNSDDGAKRTWHTTSPWADLFHANVYASVSQQRANSSWSLKIGADSPALGAHIQNRIHDTFGLYPRYPWPTNTPPRPYFEATFAVGDLR